MVPSTPQLKRVAKGFVLQKWEKMSAVGSEPLYMVKYFSYLSLSGPLESVYAA